MCSVRLGLTYRGFRNFFHFSSKFFYSDQNNFPRMYPPLSNFQDYSRIFDDILRGDFVDSDPARD